MKREYEEPTADIELFNVASPITTSWLGWEEEDENPLGRIRESEAASWE